MRCPACQTENPAEARFCANCSIPLEPGTGGAQAVQYCTSCGMENESGAQFCANCGVEILLPTGRGSRIEAGQTQVIVEYSGFWTRALALIIDTAILLVITIVLTQVTSGASAFVQWLINIIYYVLFTGLRGQTPGKMAVGIQVLNREGKVPGIWRAILREVIGKFVSVIVLLLGYIWVAFDAHKQGWHDKIAGTYVVRKR